MKKLLAVILAITLVIGCAFALSSCGPADGGEESSSDGTVYHNGVAGELPVHASAGNEMDVLSVCLASEPATIDPALNSSVDGATLIIHAFSGLAGYEQIADGSLVLYPDCAEALVDGIENEDGTVTYTYTLRDGLKWSDGSDLTAADFVYAWNRAVAPETAADYGYMMDIIARNDDGSLAVEAADDKTLVVTLANYVPYWNELLAFPTYMPVKQSAIEAAPEKWATDPATYVCNGAYTLSSWDHNSVMKYVKNDYYHNADAVSVNEIDFYLSDDANNMLVNFQNGDWQMIDDVPTNEIANLKASNPDELKIEGQLGTYYVCYNINKSLLPADSTLTGAEAEAANEVIRSALGLLLDRNYIVDYVSQGGELPASSFVAMGLTDADGATEFYQNAGDYAANGYYGYYDVSADAFEANAASAVETLKKYWAFDDATQQFTNAPTIEYLYNTNDNHKAIAEYIQQALGAFGINMTLTNQEWDTFLETRKNGDYNVARNGWLGDYNDPISFLDMWTTDSGNNDVQFGRDANADVKHYSLKLDAATYGVDYEVTDGTWAETYDYLIKQIKATVDDAQRFALMHAAEDLLMSTGCICPIYYYTDMFMISSSVVGFYSSPLGYKYFMYCTQA
ncbi:MAG: peptide ABC transporter substrate-binding protein [Clostridia bacterium]|nr:peptide ABC transporter substrate-binding protein [Clostridia bacterium]